MELIRPINLPQFNLDQFQFNLNIATQKILTVLFQQQEINRESIPHSKNVRLEVGLSKKPPQAYVFLHWFSSFDASQTQKWFPK